jgi:hypothetical protein
MDLFSYILILTSVIYALAVAQILEGLSRLTQSPRPVRLFLPHSIWVANLFLFIFLIWWATWEFRAIDWSFPKYAYMLVAPTALFLACSLLLPKDLRDEEVVLEDHFLRIRHLFFASYLVGALAVMVDGNILSDEPLWHSGRIGHLAILSAGVAGYSSSNRKVQLAVASITLLAILALAVTRFLLPR